MWRIISLVAGIYFIVATRGLLFEGLRRNKRWFGLAGLAALTVATGGGYAYLRGLLSLPLPSIAQAIGGYVKTIGGEIVKKLAVDAAVDATKSFVALVLGRAKRKKGLPGLEALRVEQSLTQATLATRSGLLPDTISALEGGERKPEFSTIRPLAKALNVEPAKLFEEPTSP